MNECDQIAGASPSRVESSDRNERKPRLVGIEAFRAQKEELGALGDKLLSVSLGYEKNLRPIGLSAEEREMSSAQTKEKKKVKVSDIWLAPKNREP